MTLVGVAVDCELLAEDWPQWRGVRRDGTWRGPALPERWPADGPRRVWRRNVGGGHSGVAAVDGRVYLFDYSKQGIERERLHCLDATDGSEYWTFEYPVTYGKLDYGTGPRTTPTIHNGHAYILGAVGHLHCLDSVTGRMVWSKDMKKEYGARQPTWGFASPPLVYKDTVIVHTGARGGASLIAFDLKHGAKRWQSLPDPTGYGAPVVFQTASGPQLVLWTPENVRSVHPDTGKLNWTVPYKVTYGVSIATPIYHRGIVFVTGYWEGSKAIRPSAGSAELVWTDNRQLRGIMSQPLSRDGFVYSVDKKEGLVCFDIQTGKKLWSDHSMTPAVRNPQVTMVWLGDEDRVIMLNSEGELILARLSTDGYSEQSRAKIVGKTWAHPAYSGRYCFARNDTELVCVELVGE